MNQAALTVAKNLGADVDGARDWLRGRSQAELRDAFRDIAELHFLSLFVVDQQGDQPAQLFLEASFDGSREGFLTRLFEVGASRALLEGAFAFCDPSPAAGASAPVWRAYLDGGRIDEEVFYVASPGRDVRQIEDERGLAAAVQAAADGVGAPEERRAAQVRRIWDALPRAARDFAMRVPPRPFWVRANLGEQPLRAIWDCLVRLLYPLGLASIALVAAAAQKIALWPSLTPPWRTIEVTQCWGFVLAVVGMSLVAVCLALYKGEFPAGLTPRMRRHVVLAKVGDLLGATLRAIPAFAALLGLIAFVHWQKSFLACAGLVLLILAMVVLLPLAFIWVRRLLRIALSEPNDRVDDMTWDAERLERVCARENEGVQTHFISVAPIRPGALRMTTLKAVLWWVGTLATIFYNPRGLFNTQSIHFARWCILPGRRLMFISNYDGSFGGYLGIFATLGATGVSAIWTNTDGFPRGFALFGDGVRDEQRFKCYARATQVESLLWYRRYPDLSVGAIDRNAAIREDLGRFARARVQDGGHIPEVELDAFLRRLSHPAA